MSPVPFCVTVASLVFVVNTPCVRAQSSTSADSKSTAIAASFSKFKSLDIEKRGVRKSKYLKVESTPVVLPDPADYSGKYKITDLDFALDLTVTRDGAVSGTGYEPISEGVMRTFTLRNGRIERSFLTATKVYADGRTERFEGAFMNRSTYESPTDKGVTVFGFGTMGRAVEVNGYTMDKFFYQKLP